MIIKKYKEIFISVIIIFIIVCGYAIKYTFIDKHYTNIENKETSGEKIIDNNISDIKDIFSTVFENFSEKDIEKFKELAIRFKKNFS